MPEPLEGTQSQPHARAVLGAALAPGGAPSHAYLFAGPAGSGKRAAARAFAAELLAEGAPDPDGARARAQRGAHPDLTWVAPSGAHELLVGDVDQPVVAAATRTPFESRRRVFVLERADAMTDEAANRLLKTLEEPASFVHLLLLSDRPGQVSPTVASRCQQVRFDPLPVAEIARRAEQAGASGERAQACARLALGDAERAAMLASDDGAALRAAAEEMARAALADDLSERPWLALLGAAGRRAAAAVEALEREFADELELAARSDQRRLKTLQAERSRRAERRVRTRTLDDGLRLVGLWFRDLACFDLDAPELALHSDRLEELRASAAAAGAGAGTQAARCRKALELVDDTRQRLELNVGEELACEALGYRLASLFGAPA